MKNFSQNYIAEFVFMLFLALSFVFRSIFAQEYAGAVLGIKAKSTQATVKKNEKQLSIGRVEKIIDSKVVFEDLKDKATKEADIDVATQIIGDNKKLLHLEQIKLKDKIAIISSSSADLASSEGKIKKVLKLFVHTATEPARLKRKVLMGVISDISDSTLTIVHQTKRERKYQVVVSDKTVVKMKSSTNLTISNLRVGQRIIVFGELDSSGTILAKRVYVIPGGAIGIFKKQPLAVPSVNLSGTPTPTEMPSATVGPTAILDTPPLVTIAPTEEPVSPQQ